MPTYTYKCQACGNVVEKRQSFSDAPLTECQDCSGELRKVLHPVGIVFKGSGFYNTDYRGNGAAKADDPAKAEGGEEAKADGGEKGKADGGEKGKADGGEKAGADAAAPAKPSEPSAPKGDTPTSAPVKAETGAPAGGKSD